MSRYIDTFLRYLWIWLIPLIVFPVVLTLIMSSITTYTATASIWVEQPIYGDQGTQQQSYYGQTPAGQMTDLLSELIHTRSFVDGVIDNTQFKNTIKDEVDRFQLFDTISTKTKIDSDKYRLIRLNFTSSNTAEALDVLNAILQRFVAYYADRYAQQTESAVTYYQKILDNDKKDLDKATNDLKVFIQAHPNMGTDTGTRTATPDDIEYNSLVQNLNNARKKYDDTNASLTKVNKVYDAFRADQTTNLKVMDKPAILDITTGKIRTFGIGIGGGLVIAIALIIICIGLITLLDGTLRFGEHATRVLRVDRVLELPNYRQIKHQKRKRFIWDELGFEESVRSVSLFDKIFRSRNKTRIVLRQRMIEQLKSK